MLLAHKMMSIQELMRYLCSARNQTLRERGLEVGFREFAVTFNQCHKSLCVLKLHELKKDTKNITSEGLACY